MSKQKEKDYAKGIRVELSMPKEFPSEKKMDEKFFQIKIATKYLGWFLPIYQFFNKESYFIQRDKFSFSSKKVIKWLAFLILGISLLSIDDLITPILAMLLLIFFHLNMKIKVIAFLTGVSPMVVFLYREFFSEKDIRVILGLENYMVLLLGFLLILVSMRPRSRTLWLC